MPWPVRMPTHMGCGEADDGNSLLIDAGVTDGVQKTMLRAFTHAFPPFVQLLLAFQGLFLHIWLPWGARACWFDGIWCLSPSSAGCRDE